MTPNEAKAWIIPAVTIAGISAAISDIAGNPEQGITAKGLPRVTIFVGAVITAAILTYLADFLPDVAGGLAATILIGALLLKGSIFSKIAKAVGG